MNQLKPKHKEFIEEYIENGNNGTQAAKDVFGIEDSKYASVKATRLLANDSIQQAITTIADALTNEELIEVHKEGLKATDDGQPDYAVRHKYLDSAYKLKGIYAPEKSVNLNLNGDIVATKELTELADKLNEIARSNTSTSVGRNGADTDTVGEEIQHQDF